MMSKCFVVLLAVLAEISAYKYDQDSYSRPEHSTANHYKYCYQPAHISDRIVTTSAKSSSSSTSSSHHQNHNVGYARAGINAAPITRNLVARGKYPVTLQNSGPAPDKKIPVVTSHLRAPVQEKPTVRLQAKIPAPKTIAHTCTCYKTIVKPRVQQHLISVPTIQRYIETFHRPVVENIHYEAYPIRCLESTGGEEKEKTQTFQVQPIEVSPISGNHLANEKHSGNAVHALEIPRTFEMPKTHSERNQVIEIPRIPFGEEQKPQTIEIPHVQFIQSKKPQTVQIELPRVQYVESQKSGFEIPHHQFFDNKKPQFVELLNAQFLENSNNNHNNNKPENVQLPRVEFLQTQKLQTVEIPRIQMEESPKVQTIEIPFSGTPFTYQVKH